MRIQNRGWWPCTLLLVIGVAATTTTPPTTSIAIRHDLRAAIKRLVDFFTQNPAALTADALLGVRLGQCKKDGIQKAMCVCAC